MAKTRGRITNQERKAKREAMNNKNPEEVNSDIVDPELNDDKEDDKSSDNDSNDIIDTDFSKPHENDKLAYEPLVNEEVIDKPYTKLQADVIGTIPDEIEEPVFERPIIDFNDPQPIIEDPMGSGPTPQSNNAGSFKAEEPPKSSQRGEYKNPAWDDMKKSEQTASAKHLADACIAAYVLINQKSAELCILDRPKLMKKAVKGQFDMDILNVTIPISATQQMTIGQWLDEKNTAIGAVCVVSEDFKAEVRPLLIELFKEQGWGMTPTQRLIMAVALDAGMKGLALFQMRSEMNYIINTLFSEGKKAKAAANSAQFTPPPPDYTPPQAPKEEEVIVPEVVTSEELKIERQEKERKEPGN